MLDPALESEDYLSLVYDELRRLAAAYMHDEGPSPSLQPTAVVHEAYLRLSELESIEWRDKSHFFRYGGQHHATGSR